MSEIDDGELDGGLFALYSLSPESRPARDAVHFRRIVAANRALRSDEMELRDAVEAARRAGDSWRAVGAALGMTPDAAERRFTKVVEEEIEAES